VAFEPILDLHARLHERFPDVDMRAAALSDGRGTADSFGPPLNLAVKSPA
jgi:hypothetical protein